MKIIALFFALIWVSCAHTPHYSDSVEALGKRKYTQAIDGFRYLSKNGSDNRRLYTLELATALHTARRYKQSNSQLRLSEKQFEEAASKTYILSKNNNFFAEGHENLAVNLISTLNFLMTKNYEGAVIEAKRIDKALFKRKIEEQIIPKQAFLMRYLSAIAWEAAGQYADAFIDYRSAYKLNKKFKYIKEDMLRTAHLSRREADLEFWQKKFKIKYKPKDSSQIVLIYQEGWAPRKVEHKEHKEHYIAQTKQSLTDGAIVDIAGYKFKPNLTYDYEKVVREDLEKKLPNETLKKLENVPYLGMLFALGNAVAHEVSEKQDPRYWATLPARYYIARKELPPGKHRLRIKGLLKNNKKSGEEFKANVITKPGQITLVNWRTFY